MNQAYSQELRVDTNRILIPAITIGTIIGCLFFTLRSTSITDVWHFWLVILLAPTGGWLAMSLIKKGHTQLGGIVFLTVEYAILTLVLFQEWRIDSTIPYLFGILILASTMFSRAETGFLAWGGSVFILVAIGFIKEGASFGSLLLMVGPIFVNFGIALVAFLSTMEWQYAVETVSDLHINVQRRRDELYTIQEEVQLANAKLESSNVKLDQARQEALAERDIRTRFMNNVSHELRTPLNAIVNFAHILRLGGRGAVTEGQIDYLERVERSGWHLLSVLNDLLDMAQIRAGEFKLHIEACDLRALCEEAMTSTRGLLLEGDVDLVRDYPEEWPVVHLDKMRIKQALINLLGNAVKYTEEGSITLRVREEGNQVLLSVIDTGIGIAPQYHEAIFQEFRQVNEADARTRVGTGLGLPITRHLVERHGGTMWVESEVGKGSTFTLVLPLVSETVAAVADNGDGNVVVLAAVAVNGVNTAVPLAPEPIVDLSPAAPFYPPPTMAVAKRVSEPVATAVGPTDVAPTAVPQPPVAARNRLLWVALAIVTLFVLAIVGYGFVNGAFGGGTGEVAAVAAAEALPTQEVSSQPAASATPSPADTSDAASAQIVTNIATAVPTHTATPAPTETPTSLPTPTATAAPATATPTTAVTPTAEISSAATALLNSSLYQAADADSPEVAFVETGDSLSVVGRSANGNWLYVSTAAGLNGFVFNERIEWNGDRETLPIINSESAPTAGGNPVSGELTLDLYVLPGTARCEGQTWFQTIFMRGQGGNGTYSYYWEGQEMVTAVVDESITFEVSQAGGTLTGTGEVLSGGQSVFKTLFITPPECN